MKAYHLLVTGSSGGGKTTYLREVHATADCCSLFLTPKSHESNVAGNKVAGRKGLSTSVTRASRPSDVRCKWLGASYPESAQTAREWAHAIREQKGWPVQIIVDECQQAEEMTSANRGPIRSGLHEDRDRGIKWVLSTQDPQDLQKSYSSIKQCRYIVWCGPVKTFHKGFLEYYNIDPSLLPEREYKYVTITPSLPPTVAYRGETNATYS